MAHGQVPGQARQGHIVEDLGDQPQLLEDDDRPAVGDRDTRRFLAPMLQRVQPVVG